MLRVAALSTVAIVILFLGLGCSTVLRLPPEVGEQERVYLLSYSTWGHHSLAFYSDDALVEFTYGDWELFALNQRDGWTAWKNMTFRSQGALGRKVVAWEPGTPICPLFHACLDAVSFNAPAANVQALYERLQNDYALEVSSKVLNEVEQVFFVKYDVPYWGLHNCNHELADWLEALGATVSGRVFLNPDFIGGMRGPPTVSPEHKE